MLWGKLLYSVFFFCEESLVRDTNLHYKDCSEKCNLVVAVKWRHHVNALLNPRDLFTTHPDQSALRLIDYLQYLGHRLGHISWRGAYVWGAPWLGHLMEGHRFGRWRCAGLIMIHHTESCVTWRTQDELSADQACYLMQICGFYCWLKQVLGRE